MPRGIVVWGALPVLALSYAALRSGGEDPVGVNAVLLLLGTAGVVWSLTAEKAESVTVWERRAILAALLFPAYVAFQLLPLPVAALRILDPTRAALSDGLSVVMAPPILAPVSILPGMTWAHLARIVGYALMFLLVYWAARRSERVAWRFAAALVVLGAFEAILGLSQHSAGAMVVLGTYRNQNHFSALLEMALPFALVITVALAGRVQLRGTFLPSTLASMAGAAAAAAAMIGGIAASLSRAGFIAMLGSIGVMAAIWFYPVASPRARRAIVPLFFAVCVLAFFLVTPLELIENFGELSTDPYEDARWRITLDTARMFADFPLLGAGLGTYYPAFLPYQSVSLNLTWLYTHNDYLQLLTELGIVGFLVVAALIVVVLRCAGRAAVSFDSEARLLGVGCVGSLAAILFHSVADFNLYIPANALVMSCVAGIAVSLEGRRIHEARMSIWPAVRLFVPAIAVWLVVFSGGWLAVLNAAELDPATEARLCRVGLCNSFSATNALKARHGGDLSVASPEELARILATDPAGAYNWLNIGDSFEGRGMIDKARLCFTRALALGPNIPFFQMRAAHFYFRQREFHEGLRLMARSIDGNPVFRDAAFDTYANHEIPLEDVLQFGIGSTDAAQAYLRKLLADKKNSASAAVTWASLVGKGWSDDKLAAVYANTLLEWKEYDVARRVWFTDGGDRLKADPANYVFNGDFESDPTDSRFDWRLRTQPGVAPSLDLKQAFSGNRAARLDFDGTENVHRIELYQSVYLPAAHYELDAVMKVDGVTTREGVLLEIVGQGVQASTEPLTGTADWVRVSARFDVPADAGLLQLSAVRKRSFRFDNKIRGRAWIDQVRISRVDKAGTS